MRCELRPHLLGVVFPPVMLVLAGCTTDSLPTAEEAPSTRFIDVTDRIEVSTEGTTATDGDRFMPESMVGGVLLFDFDGDGDLDLYHLGQGAGRGEEEKGRNRLYRQRAPWDFEDVTEGSGAGDPGYAMGVAAGDVDQDGDLDLYISNLGPDRLLQNDGNGVFTDITELSGIDVDGWSSSVAFADIDGDSHLDIYVARYLEFPADFRITDSAGRPEYPSPALFSGVQDQLLKNNGDGTFINITSESGIDRVAKGLGVLSTDLDGDGNVDFYVANDGEPNQAWMGDGSGRFVDSAMKMGLAINQFGQAEAGMGIAHGDVNEDGFSDILVTHLVTESDTLYINHGEGAFVDETGPRGLAHSTIDGTGFGTSFADVDHDGDLDLVTVRGRVLRGSTHPRATGIEYWKSYGEEDLLFLNDGEGRFRLDRESGFSSRISVSRGLAIGDLDKDGDVDLVIAEAAGVLRWWENQTTTGSWWLLSPVAGETRVLDLGATLRFETSDGSRVRSVSGSGNYLSGSDTRVHFSAGTSELLEIHVLWSDGTSEQFEVPPPNSAVPLIKGSGR